MTIAIESTTSFDGPNIWARAPVIRLLIATGGEKPGAAPATGIGARLTSLLPLLADTSPSNIPLDPRPFPADLGPPAALGMLILNLQRLAGFDVAFTFDRPVTVEISEVVVERSDDVVGGAAVALAVRVLNHLIAGDEPGDDHYRTLASRFGALAASRRGGTAIRTIIAAAKRRGIPVSITDPSGRIVELGTGAHRRRTRGSFTSLTPKISDEIVSDKQLTNLMLREAGLPVPDGAAARDVKGAIAIARDLGCPVVLKPVDFGASVGVFVDLRDEEEVRACFASAAAASPSGRVLVERHIPGLDYRVLVVNGQIVAVGEHWPASVLGDGRNTVRALIDIANADPRRGPAETKPLKAIVADELTLETLARNKLDLDAVPEAGRRVPLKPTGKVPYGGVAIDRTDHVHPDNAAIFTQAARVAEADVVSMDVIAPDISRSIWETGGAILELNLGSGFRNELYPAEGPPRDPGPAIVDMLFPPGQPVRAPVIAVIAGPPASDRICSALAEILTSAGASVGLAAGGELSVAGSPIRGDGVRTLLRNPCVEVVVVDVEPREIVERGLGFGICDLAVVTSLSGLTTPAGRPVETVLTDMVEPGGALVFSEGVLAHARENGAALFILDPAKPVETIRRAMSSVAALSGWMAD